MAETDSFIDEVTEQVRRDRLFKVYKKYGWILVLLVVGIVGGAAYNEYAKAKRIAAGEAAGRAFAAATADSDPAALQDLVAAGGDVAVVAQLQQAALFVANNDRGAALTILNTLASDANLAPAYRDLALLKLVIMDGANMSAGDLDAALGSLTLPGAPYRMLALEQSALRYMRDGDTAAALRELEQIVNASDASEGLRRRAQELTIALGGEVSSTQNG